MKQSMSNEVVIDIQTGDLLFCYGGENEYFFDFTINNVRHCCYDHIAMAVRNPCFKDFTATGLYVLEIDNYLSGLKNRIKITTFDEFVRGRKRIDIRCWFHMPDRYKIKLNNIYVNVTDTPYSRLCCFKRYKYDKYFFNGELIAYCLREMGIFKPNKFLEHYEPADFSKDINRMPSVLENLIRLL